MVSGQTVKTLWMLQMRIHLLTVVVLLSALAALSAADEPSEREKDLADELMASYTSNRAAFSKYAVAALIERFIDDKKTPDLSGFSGDWFLLCTDKEENIQRLDYVESIGVSNEVSARTPGETLLSVDRKHYQFINGKSWGELEVKEEDDLLKPLKIRMPRFDPWDLALGTSTMFSRQRTLQGRVGEYERQVFTPDKLVKFVTTPDRYSLCYLNSEKYSVYLHVAFDRRRNNLPVESRMLIGAKNPGDFGATVSTLKTEWAELRSEKGWVPVEVTSTSTRGPARKPARRVEEIVTFFWAFEKNVPEKIFSTASFIPTIELRDHIIDVQATSSELRMPPKRK